MARRIIGGVGAAIGVAGALAGCGGGSSHSFTIKADNKGDVAYIVVTTPAPEQAVAGVLLGTTRSAGAAAFLTTASPTLPFDCKGHAKIGSSGIPASALHPYTGDDVSIAVYGIGSFADGVCSGLIPSAVRGS